MTWVIVRFSNIPETGLKGAMMRAMQASFTSSFLRAAGSLDRQWRSVAIRHRLMDSNLLPPERARLERLPR